MQDQLCYLWKSISLPLPLNGEELLFNKLIQFMMKEKCKAYKNQTKTNTQKPGIWLGPNEDLILLNSLFSPSFQKKMWRSVNILPTIPYQIFLLKNKTL